MRIVNLFYRIWEMSYLLTITFYNHIQTKFQKDLERKLKNIAYSF